MLLRDQEQPGAGASSWSGSNPDYGRLSGTVPLTN
jgi:hypothetical protein